ncbi:MAG TPA: hypothetical protein VHY19_02195 [Steroidobacteraceae bacterium]|nr:hypothetical protein [Steroidobacteraceae bacterium]
MGVALVGCATTDTAPVAAGSSPVQRALVALSHRSDANSLATAGLLSRSHHGDGSLALIRRAAATDPARPDLVWLETLSCEQTSGCDAQSVELKLRALDPKNGVGWFGALARADSRHDREAANQALRALAASRRVDIYWNPLVAMLSRAVYETKAMSAGEAQVTVIGFLAAEPIPAFRDVADGCKGEHLKIEGRLVTCRGIAKALEQGDTYITAMLGDSIAMRVWPEGSPEWQAAYRSRRTGEYQLELEGRLDAERSAAPWQYVPLFGQYRREQDVLRARLIQAGLNPDPPSNPAPGN